MYIKVNIKNIETIQVINFYWVEQIMDKRDLTLFKFLDGTHASIHNHLDTLKELVQRISEDNLGSKDKKQLGQICSFFDTEVREHHLQEESMIFPSLIHSDDLKNVRIANQLFQDHGWLEENWIELGPMLRAIENGQSWPNTGEILHAFDIFYLLNLEHMQLEESIAYPQARESLKKWRLEKSGRELHQLKKSQKRAAQPHH